MEIPVRNAGLDILAGIRAVAAGFAAVALASCASVTSLDSRLGLEAPEVTFSSGRVLLVLTDEYGMPMTRTRVDFSWDSPEFYKTSAFTNSIGQVTFSGVPEVAEVIINHPGGSYQRTLIVPQRGIAELRVILDTYGANQVTRAKSNVPLTPEE